MANIEKIIKTLLEDHREQALLDLLEGDAEASRLLVHPERVEEKILLAGAVLHLKFLLMFPGQTGQVVRDGKVYSAFPDEFQQWLASGTPGLNEAALAEAGLLALNPDLNLLSSRPSQLGMPQ